MDDIEADVAAFEAHLAAEQPLVEQSVSIATGPPPTVLDQAIRLASIQGIDKDMFDRIMAANEREVAAQAMERFNEAMNLCKAEIQPVARTAENKATNSLYAKIEAVDAAIRPIYTKYGFNVSYGTEPPLTPGNIRVYCEVALGRHSQRFYREAAADTHGPKGTQTKTLLHGGASTETFLRRYCLTGAFNVVFRGLDDDGNKGGARHLDEKQCMELGTMIDETNTNPDNFFRTMLSYEVTVFQDINVLDFDRLMNTLRNKKRLQSKGAPE